ncbi:hypothetical protein IGI04_041352 [Brassica rapa subsp. trilocularis]|uniref:Uncharacterized protein n=1 Tax=Brassica rapa subsp. trilocularis TaxID=1813537 RepID=A0ABQ7KRP5_BRACM|nr:hypothetical protein IGI04_041352 [Brassica rapa subsp. trilocularis]
MWDGKKRLHSIIIESRISLFHVWKVLPFASPRSLPSTLHSPTEQIRKTFDSKELDKKEFIGSFKRTTEGDSQSLLFHRRGNIFDTYQIHPPTGHRRGLRGYLPSWFDFLSHPFSCLTVKPTCRTETKISNSDSGVSCGRALAQRIKAPRVTRKRVKCPPSSFMAFFVSLIDSLEKERKRMGEGEWGRCPSFMAVTPNCQL